MRDYGKIRTRFWNHPTVKAMPDQAKLLLAYLLTCEHANALGAFRCPEAYIMEDLGWSANTVRTACQHCVDRHFLMLGEGGWVFLPKYLKHNPPENASVGVNIERCFDAIPEWSNLISNIADSIRAYPDKLPESLLHRLDTVSTPCRHPEPEPRPEPRPEPDTSPEPSSMDSGPAFIQFPTNRKNETYTIRQAQIDEWRELYPAVDVEQELRKMKGWCDANPDRRKTKRGMPRFITNWLSKAQDQGGNGKPPPPAGGGARLPSWRQAEIEGREAYLEDLKK